jgi:hypothetical protein
MEDPIGVMPLLSFSEERGSEVHVSVPSTSLDGELMRHMLQGIKMERVTISTTRFNLELDDVLISSVVRGESAGEPVVDMTLSFTSQHLK